MPEAGYDVVMLTSAHPATDDRIFYREAKTLAEAGLTVSVVGRHPRQEIIDGIAIYNLPSPRSRRERILLSWTVLKMAVRLRGRLYIFHDPELFGIGLVLRMLGKRVVYDSHENLPKQVLQKDYLPRPIRYLISPGVYVAEFTGARLLSGVIAAIPVTQARFPRGRTVLVRNFPTTSALEVLGGGPDVSSRANVAIYAGGLSRIRGIGELVKAFEGLEGAELWLVGKFEDPEFESEILATLPKNVKWFGWKPFPEVLKLYNSAKIGMLPHYPMPNHRNSVPVKLFEYLGAGLPVVVSNFPEFSTFMEGCGLQVDPHSAEEIRAAVRALFSDPAKLSTMSALARGRVRTSLSWEPEGIRLVQFCGRLVAESNPAATRRQHAHG
jgi:glycosyltransferase involved in cell wall biosynthesis